jgi:hypothetical protein
LGLLKAAISMFIEIGVYGGAIPFAVALALVYLTRRFAPPHVFERFAMAAALAVAFFVGWVLLPEGWTPLKPARQWHWLPYIGLLAAALGGAANQTTPFADSGRAAQRILSWALRFTANVLTAGVAAWMLAPNWPDLEPPRYVYILLLGGGLFALMTLLDALPARILGPQFPFVLFAAASATAIFIAEPVSLQYGQVAGITSAALLGCTMSTALGIKGAALRGLSPVYAVLVVGIAFTGSIEPEPPIYAILFAPLAPLMLWICAYGPWSRLSDVKGAAVQCALVLLPLAILAAWILLGGEPEEYPEYDY